MEPLPIAAGAVLRPYTEADVEELTAVIAADREHLAAWLPWAASHGYADSVDYIARKEAQIAANDGFEGAIVLDDRIVGGAGFHGVDWINRSTSIGYWLVAEVQGRGLMSATVRALVDYAFGAWDLHRVTIEVVVDNVRSRAIPERLGFTEEGILREAKLIRGSYEDAVLYAMLEPDWSPSAAREAIGNE